MQPLRCRTLRYFNQGPPFRSKQFQFLQETPLIRGSEVDPSTNNREAIDILSVVDQPPSEDENSASGSKEEPLYGTDIPSEVFNRAVTIVKNQLGYETPVVRILHPNLNYH